MTVRSADQDDPAVIREFYLRGVRILVLEDIFFDDSGGLTDKPERALKRRNPFQVLDSGALTIRDSSFKGRIYAWGGRKISPAADGLRALRQGARELTIERPVFRGWNHRGFVGLIDDVEVRSRALSAEQVRARHGR